MSTTLRKEPGSSGKDRVTERQKGACERRPSASIAEESRRERRRRTSQGRYLATVRTRRPSFAWVRAAELREWWALSGVRGRPLASVSPELLLRKTFGEYPRHFLGLHAQLRPNLLRTQAALVLLHESDDPIEGLGDLLRATARKAPSAARLARRSCRAGCAGLARGAGPPRTSRPRTTATGAGEQLLERSGADGVEHRAGERVGETAEIRVK